jgi:hypothetical protein
MAKSRLGVARMGHLCAATIGEPFLVNLPGPPPNLSTQVGSPATAALAFRNRLEQDRADGTG